jgi:uncharacterized protein YbjQ (UPF0145 family)
VGLLDRLLGGGDGGDDDERREADIARVEAGGIPLAAEARIRELGAGAGGFTSGLSVADFLLTRQHGVRPVCQVMGSSVYKVGWQSYPWGSAWQQAPTLTELDALTTAWNTARARALARLQEEATLAGCHAVVDVTFERRDHAFLSDAVEVVVNGTAVHLPEGDRGGPPILTDLSMPDWVLLRRGGYDPVGVVATTSVFYVVPGRQTRNLTQGWQRFTPNQELTDFTQGLYEARERALGRAAQTATALGAGGMVGMSIDHDVETRTVGSESNEREDLIVTFHVLGTAIAPQAEHRPLHPRTVVRQGARRP